MYATKPSEHPPSQVVNFSKRLGGLLRQACEGLNSRVFAYMSLGNSTSEGSLAVAPEAIPPLNQRSTPTSGVTRRPIFKTDGSHQVHCVTPQPPSGAPPFSALGPVSALASLYETTLPGIISPRRGGEGGHFSPKPASLTAHPELESSRKTTGITLANPGERETGRRIIDATYLPTSPSPAKLTSLMEALVKESERVAPANSGEPRRDLTATINSGGLETRSSPPELTARKAHLGAEVRSIAHQLSRVGEKERGTESGEIERALAAVDETRRKRMARQRSEHGELEQNEEKFRRRQEKREQLMRKRKDMEDRLKEEAIKMAELTESAKKKGETKFMSEEAKRDAEERIQVEAEAIARLEHQAADMARRREKIQRDLAKVSQEKATEIEKQAIAALQAKRALVDAQIKQEEEEIKNASEAAKREVKAKMVTEAAAIAEMERQAQEMAAKRAQLEVDLTDRIQRDKALRQEAEFMSHKREEIEAKMRQQEAELRKLSKDTKRRVEDKMAVEAAAIAKMEREAKELAAERETMESRRAYRATFASTRVESPANSEQSGAVQNLTANAVNTDKMCTHSDQGERDSLGLGGIDGNGTGTLDSMEETGATATTCLENRKGHPPNGLVSNDKGGPTLDNHLSEENLVGEHPVHSTVASNVCSQCRPGRLGMSPAHMAAATGHVFCLEALRRDQHSTLLLALDSAGRSPLFYACANAHVEAADLLIRVGAQSCEAICIDANHDTPLHAAALAGSSLCCRLLLQSARCDVDSLNATHMTPAHLAANNDVLEVLSQYGADMNAKDADSRTPLFLACAFDRLEKAEFLCDLVECAGQDLGEADKRGDSPMHAAAYNGSTACLLLLLQYGVAPDVRNLKGLRPIDLASRRRHSACKKILMEYQLHHHVDNTNFDSVLFLATLEGYKKCKETLTDDQRPGAEVDCPLVHSNSMLSLCRGQSIRLEYWGEWIAYEDQNAQATIWYNHVTKKAQWEVPSGIRRSDASTLAHASMRLKQDGDWIEYTLSDGNAFYYNDKSNEFQWERPDQVGETSNTRHGIYSPCCTATSGDAGDSGDDDNVGATIGEWTAFQDPSTGLVFWHNKVSGGSQWEPPDEISTAGKTLLEEEGDSIALDEDMREVTSVDDILRPR